jgi:phosphatidylglycerol:prolipoprotein diacylglycerol transferase
MADLFAPSVALGLSFARIGCFMAGCCYGKETVLPWAVTFTHPQSLARLGVRLHPTQLYEAAGCLALFLFLTWMEKKKSYEGEIFWLFLLVYSLLRFLIEFFRDDPRGFLFGTFLSTSQAIGVLLAIFSVYMLNYYWKS